MTTTKEFNNGHLQVVVSRNPRNSEHASLIVQRAWQDIQSGRRWTAFDNCQDFVSRAYEGKDGSMTRNAIFGALAVSGVLLALSGDRG